MVEIKINGVKTNFPTLPEDITISQFLQLMGADNVIKQVSVLTGISYDEAINFKDMASINKAGAMCNVLAQNLRTFKYVPGQLPKIIRIGEAIIEVPKKLRLQPIGAFMSVQKMLEQRNTEHAAAMLKDPMLKTSDINYTNLIPLCLAHYFYLPYFGDTVLYSDTKAEDPEYLELINQIPFPDAIKIGNDFFLKYPNLT